MEHEVCMYKVIVVHEIFISIFYWGVSLCDRAGDFFMFIIIVDNLTQF